MLAATLSTQGSPKNAKCNQIFRESTGGFSFSRCCWCKRAQKEMIRCHTWVTLIFNSQNAAFHLQNPVQQLFAPVKKGRRSQPWHRITVFLLIRCQSQTSGPAQTAKERSFIADNCPTRMHIRGWGSRLKAKKSKEWQKQTKKKTGRTGANPASDASQSSAAAWDTWLGL